MNPSKIKFKLQSAKQTIGSSQFDFNSETVFFRGIFNSSKKVRVFDGLGRRGKSGS